METLWIVAGTLGACAIMQGAEWVRGAVKCYRS